jgi:hypothetical protein
LEVGRSTFVFSGNKKTNFQRSTPNVERPTQSLAATTILLSKNQPAGSSSSPLRARSGWRPPLAATPDAAARDGRRATNYTRSGWRPSLAATSEARETTRALYRRARFHVFWRRLRTYGFGLLGNPRPTLDINFFILLSTIGSGYPQCVFKAIVHLSGLHQYRSNATVIGGQGWPPPSPRHYAHQERQESAWFRIGHSWVASRQPRLTNPKRQRGVETRRA